MFYDQNITKTKAFREQLNQHSELFEAWSEPSPRVKDRVIPKVGETLVSGKNWLFSLISAPFNLRPHKSA